MTGVRNSFSYLNCWSATIYSKISEFGRKISIYSLFYAHTFIKHCLPARLVTKEKNLKLPYER